jgi:CHRD domain-containing protein
MKIIRLIALLIALSAFFISCQKDDVVSSPVDFNSAGLPMTGTQETPAVTTTASGTIDIAYSRSSKILAYIITWQNLSGPVAALYIHGPSQAGYQGSILQKAIASSGGVVTPNPTKYGASGSYSGFIYVDDIKIKESDVIYNKLYANIYTAANQAGEIRGRLIVWQ